MRKIEICGQCGGEVPFDIVGVNISRPVALQSCDDFFKEIPGHHDLEEFRKTLEELYKDRPDRKTVQFFSKCPKCGTQYTLLLYGIPLI